MKKLLATLVIGLALVLPASVVGAGVAAAASPGTATHAVTASIPLSVPASVAAGGQRWRMSRILAELYCRSAKRIREVHVRRRYDKWNGDAGHDYHV